MKDEESHKNFKSESKMENEKKDIEEEEALESKASDKTVNNEIDEGETVESLQDETEQEEAGNEEQAVLTTKEVDELRKKAEEGDSHLDKLLRTRAEFMNYQKRMRKESEGIARYAIQDLILDLLPEFDNFERAIKLADNTKDVGKFVEGIKLIETQLFKVLGKYGVKPIETIEKPFDPKLHEAVIEEDNNELPHHTVIEELQRGYFLKERVIRPSKVKVSKRTVKEDEETNDESDKVDGNSSES